MCVPPIADVLESVLVLGSEGGQAILMFNSCLVCHVSLDVEFYRVALAGCFQIKPSLSPYLDNQLPHTPAALTCCVFVSPLLFAMTEDGIVCILPLMGMYILHTEVPVYCTRL